MTWRRIPPVVSPVSPASFPSAIAAATGLRDHRDHVAASLRERYAADEVVLTDSGTSALVLALRHVVPAGGTVAYPAYGCIDLTTAALGAGVRVRLYDLDPATMSPDLDSVRRAVARGVDAIVVAHLFGYPADVYGVQTIADEHGIPVIEDAAQAAGGALSGKPLGSLAGVSVLSFGRGKGTTGGSGGAILVRSAADIDWARAQSARLARNHRGVRDIAALAAQWLLARPALYRLPLSVPGLRLGEMVFHEPHQPRAMSAASASFLQASLNLEREEVDRRRSNAAVILGSLRGSSAAAPVRSIPGGAPGYLRLACVDGSGRRNLRADLGLVRAYPMTLDQHPQLAPLLENGERAGSGAERLRDRLFTAPTHSRVSGADLRLVVESMNAPSARAHGGLSPVPVS